MHRILRTGRRNVSVNKKCSVKKKRCVRQHESCYYQRLLHDIRPKRPSKRHLKGSRRPIPVKFKGPLRLLYAFTFENV